MNLPPTARRKVLRPRWWDSDPERVVYLDLVEPPRGLPVYLVIGLLSIDRPAMGIVMNVIATRK